MPQPRKIDKLPHTVKSELGKRIVESGYSDYTEHTKWLNSLECTKNNPISRSAVARYGRELKERIGIHDITPYTDKTEFNARLLIAFQSASPEMQLFILKGLGIEH